MTFSTNSVFSHFFCKFNGSVFEKKIVCIKQKLFSKLQVLCQTNLQQMGKMLKKEVFGPKLGSKDNQILLILVSLDSYCYYLSLDTTNMKIRHTDQMIIAGNLLHKKFGKFRGHCTLNVLAQK